ncbi:MAG TPA: YceI family protein [Candidatus Binataceae bacterium]|jgi:polyisoprenoid-binding protein YceI|nr:YceI family protein [Candidatus Binataceae bacterium]
MLHQRTPLRVAALAFCISMLAQAAGAEVLRLEPDYQKSEITATVDEPLGLLRDHPSATGKFEIIKGEIDGDPEDVAHTAHVKLVINATTYDSGNSSRDTTVIHSALETWKYQTIIFESSHLEDINIEVPGASGDATVVGNLTLHGVTRTMRVPVRVSMDTDGQFSAGGELTFDYTEFGIKPPRLLFALPAGKQVTIAFRILAQRPAAPPPAQSRREERPANHPPRGQVLAVRR